MIIAPMLKTLHVNLSSAVPDVLVELAPGLELDLLQGMETGETGSDKSDPAKGSGINTGSSNSLGLRKLISAAFRVRSNSGEGQPEDGQIERTAEAFRALRILLEQQYLSRCSSSCTTGGWACSTSI